MSNDGKLLTPTTLQFERLLPGPIDRVWEFITEAEKRSKWFCGGTSEMSAGEEIKFVFHNSNLGSPPQTTPEKYKEFGDGFESKAVVVRSEKPNIFAIEWEGLVTFELIEQGEMVKLTLTHEKLQDSKETRVGTMAGWHTHLDILGDQLNKRESKSFWTVHMDLENQYASKID
ncbi:SRPBCC family protein [Ekhidna sp. To15]|uniref:SRPBCC family protein n=1 Tax=Ekhidna sp. To15 TaxID=3395267 RepID=UPI003F51B520